MATRLQAVRGMNDVLPDEAERWLWLEDIVGRWFTRYGYRQIRTPLLEQTGLFRRAIGEVTDIVEKEMYTFTDALNEESLTLRPEATASTVRAAAGDDTYFLSSSGPSKPSASAPNWWNSR